MISRMKARLFVLNILIILVIVTRSDFFAICDAKIDRLLKKLNKPALKSIKSPDRDIIDCVHMKNHPIYDHPLFKNHTIQMRPSFYPKRLKNVSSNTNEQLNMVSQLWRTKGKCPKNSIPIKRTTREDILRAKSIERYRKKDPNNILQPKQVNSTSNHEYAVIGTYGTFHGATATINVWKPYVKTRREFSLAQIWVKAGPAYDCNTIEVGWQVYQGRNGDFLPRQFIYWTADGYNLRGCYNLLCDGFVVTDPGFAIGAAYHFSTLNGQQYHIPTTIWKDPHSGHWWLRYFDHLVVGYWPFGLFTHLQNGATEIQWGGEITNYRDGSQHTTTQMGSGRFAQEGFQKASYFRNVQIIDENNFIKHLAEKYTYTTRESCYNISVGFSDDWGVFFYYGGPGQNPNCQ